MHYDVFNGDADGIIALLQLRLSEQKQSKLVTGVKRDIKLLSQVVKCNDVSSVTTLDVSMEKNLEPLTELLNKGIKVFYCDHHRTGDIPASEWLTSVIDLDAEKCTSLLIHQYLEDQYGENLYVAWAIAGAFGDNLLSTATALANVCGYSTEQVDFLKELGTLINYNGYGSSLSDLHIEPAELYRELLAFPNPFDLLKDQNSPYYRLKQGYAEDYQNVNSLIPTYVDEVCAVYEFPAEPWARRISGVFGNDLANQAPSKAHAVLTLNPSNKDYTVSVRAPLTNRVGADDICSQFPTGGGRKGAAGINKLPIEQKSAFIHALSRHYSA
ncbi:DHH family phosphoesterase [Vibrio owensii]|uniref:DHH family phosphoesterase n=1 Tax=Vibrio owensii TaxID=696485 RepID=A0AAP9GG89_9VIBR|nr:hypothetical protein [Vibrio owensii]AYO17479.1 DHH family phosphoesterase [Vibrio owensii]QGH49621.1 DHH family phosphoesterase [Vibrio owensii]